MSLRKTPPFLASKWLHIDLLVDTSEMKSLFQALEPFSLFSTLGVQEKGKNSFSQEQFLSAWQRYIEQLQSGDAILEADFRFYFTAILTSIPEAVTALELAQEREIIVPILPIIQMQPHRFAYSEVDQTFRSMVFGAHSVSWGIRLSYPQLFQDPVTRQVENALDESHFPNAKYFSRLRQWVRVNTQPTPILAQAIRCNVPIRIGKNCFSWIGNHPELRARNLCVLVS